MSTQSTPTVSSYNLLDPILFFKDGLCSFIDAGFAIYFYIAFYIFRCDQGFLFALVAFLFRLHVNHFDSVSLCHDDDVINDILSSFYAKLGTTISINLGKN